MSVGLPGWTFTVDEISNSYYRGLGKHVSGLEVSADGAKPEEVIEACKRYARALSESLGRLSR